MKAHLFIFIFLIVLGCKRSDHRKQSSELIKEVQMQESIFRNLRAMTNYTVPTTVLADSLAFLILPVQAICPSCRKKTIDSIVKHQKDLQDRHYIIISAGGGRKTINGFFLEQDRELPVIEDQLFLDSTNRAFTLELVKDRPTIYYAHNGKVYKKVAAIPATVREDLKEFFSGHRND